MKTIESKIAKNGVTMYFEVDENGKKRRIKADAYVVMECAMQYTAQREHDDAMSEVNTSADAIDAAVEAEIEIVNSAVTEEIAEVNARRFLVSVHYDNNGANGMESKHFATSTDAANYIIAFAEENPEYVINTDTNIRDFDAHKKYTLTDADLHILNGKPAADEIAEINAADVKINVADNGKIIEQIKVSVDEAVAIINRLNYRKDTFVYCNTTRYDNADIKCRHFDAYKADGEKDAFAITEYVIGGKLEIVRFFNLYRDITVDMKIGNVEYTIGDKGAIVLSDDEATTDWNSTFHTFEIGKTYFCSNEVDGKAEVTTLTVIERTAAMLTGKTVEGTRKYHIDEAVNSEVVKLHEGIDAPRIYAGFEYTDAVKAVSTDNHSRFVEEVAAIFEGKTPADMYTDEYIITQEAMDEAIEAEELEALAAKQEARILADPAIDAAYRKAKERVEVTFTKYGYPIYRYRKTSGEWTDNERVAKAYIGKCGLSETSFIVKAKHDTPSGDIADAETAEVIPVERFWCEVEIGELSEQDAADIVAHFHGQDGANKFFKMRAAELDGSEEDDDNDNVFDLLPTLDELQDVDIDDDDNTPPDDEPMSDDIDAICKYNPDLEDDDKSCLLDWDDSAIAHIPTGEEELAAFINPQIVIEQGYLEPAIIDNGKTYTESKYAAKVAAENYEPAFTTKTDKNGKTLYYIDGKRVSRDDYFWEYDRRSKMIDEMLDKRMDWFDKPEDIYEDATTLESVSGIERDEHIDAEIADKYIAIEGATVQSVEVKTDGRRNSYYIDGKRTSRDKALDACAKMRGDNHFTIEYQRGRYGDDGKIVYSTERKTMSRIDLKIGTHDKGFSVYFYNGFATVHIFEEYEDAKACFSQIEAAFFAGLAGVKVDSDGKVSDLDEMPDLAADLVAGEKIYMGNRTCTYNVNGEKVHFDEGEWFLIESDKYGVRLFRDYNGLAWDISNIDGRRRKLDCTEAEFWQAMIERGACTIDLTDAEKLTAKLKKVTRKATLMEIYPQVGQRIVDNLCKVEIVPDGGGFIFTNGYEALARYDNREQCQDVIGRIKTAIEGCDTEFEFPTAEHVALELKLPALLIESFNKYKYRSKGRSIPRRFLAAQLKYYGLTIADLRAYKTA